MTRFPVSLPQDSVTLLPDPFVVSVCGLLLLLRCGFRDGGVVGWDVLTVASFLFSTAAGVISDSCFLVLVGGFLGGELVGFFAGSVVVLIVSSFLVPVILSPLKALISGSFQIC